MRRKMEEISLNALPALKTMYVGGWILRFSEGLTKRANSVHPIYESADTQLDDKIATSEALYLQENECVIFKIYDESKFAKLDAHLIKRGYRKDAHVSVQVALLTALVVEAVQDVKLVMYESFEAEWLTAFSQFSDINKADQVTLQKMLELVIPRKGYFLLINEDNLEVLACGLGVLEGEYLGLFDIVTNPAYRKKGFGEQLVREMLNWGRLSGSKYSYLQVLTDNKPARALYEKLGFSESYTYWFRIKDKSDFT